MKSPSPPRLLKQALAEHLDWHGARLSFLAPFILALFKVRTVNFVEIAQAFSGRAKLESHYRRLQRFFQQFAIDEATVARLVVRLVPVGEGPWYLTLDRTNWKFGRCEINILMLGMAYRGIAVPLFWTLLPKAGNANTSERIELMERFLAVFGGERIQALLAEREFVGGKWFGYLQAQQIPFRIRIKQNTRVPNRWNKRMPAQRLFQSLASGQVRQLPGRRPIWGCFVFLVARRLEDGTLLIIATTDQPEQALADYARRWEIGVSGEGHIIQSVQVRPRLIDSSLVAGEAAWRESKTLKPSDNVHRGCTATRQVVTCSERRGSLVTRNPVAEPVHNVRRQQGPYETSPIRRLSPAGYRRRHDAKDDVATGEALGARRRKLAEEVVPITVSGKWRRRHQGGGSGRSTEDRRAAKRAGREGPGPVGNPFVQSKVGVR